MRETGLEPAASTLATLYSTIEILSLNRGPQPPGPICGPLVGVSGLLSLSHRALVGCIRIRHP